MKRWAIPAAFVVAIEYAVALAIGFRVGFRYSIPFATYATVGLTVIVLAFAVVIAARFVASLGKGDVPSNLGRFASFSAGVLLVTAQMAVLMWLKVMLPIASPFWADALLANLDRTIFFTDPWRITHALLGRAEWLDAVYVTWAPLKMAVLLFILVMPDDFRKARALLSYFLIFACGELGQYLSSSAGPIFYQRLGLGDHFASVPVQPWVQTASNYLWRDYLSSGGDIGAGISAMPSMHVALALWVALAVRSYFPRLQAFGWAWFSLILVGSIHLGWHYAADGIVASLIAVLMWRLAAVSGDRILWYAEGLGFTCRPAKAG